MFRPLHTCRREATADTVLETKSKLHSRQMRQYPYPDVSLKPTNVIDHLNPEGTLAAPH